MVLNDSKCSNVWILFATRYSFVLFLSNKFLFQIKQEDCINHEDLLQWKLQTKEKMLVDVVNLLDTLICLS